MVENNVGRQKSLNFIRRDGFSLQTGRAVAYTLSNGLFQIEATRDGVTFHGSFPTVTRAGILAVTQTLIRAVRHHEHLKSFPLGTKQEALAEETIEAEEVTGSPLPDAVETKGRLIS